MSVVNKMLQDLEARKAAPDVISADYVVPPKSASNILYILIIILLLAIAASVWFIGSQWTQERQVSLDLSDVKTQENQTSTQSTPPDFGKELSNEANIRPNINANKNIESTSEVPFATTKILAATQPKAGDLLPIANVQQYAQPGTNGKGLHHSNNVSEYVVDSEVKNQTMPDSRFSISDSSAKDKAAGAKQGVINALSEGNNELAIRRLEELLRGQPDNIEARKKLAALLFAQKRSNQAEHVLRQGINNHPLRGDLRLMLARLYVQKKGHNAAIKLLNEIQPEAANQLEYLAYRAALLQQNAHYEQAKGDYLQLIRIDTVNAKWWLGLAITQDRLGQSTEALSAYRTAYSKEQLSRSVVKFIEQRIIQIEGVQ